MLKLEKERTGSTPGGIYSEIAARLDFANSQPCRRQGVAVKEQIERQAQVYILRSPSQAYMRLDERDYFIWQRLDGQHSIKQIATEYLDNYQSIGGLKRIQQLLGQLQNSGFLSENKTDLYRQLQQKIKRPGPVTLLIWLEQTLLTKTFHLPQPDKWLAKIYYFSRLFFFNLIAQLFWLAFTIAGTALFIAQAGSGAYRLFDETDATLLTLFLLLSGYYFTTLLHELGHGLTAKHFGAIIPDAGAMFYVGVIAFYVNTSDVWMKSRRARVLVSIAGPYCNALVGSLAAFGLQMLGPAAAPVLFPLAFSCYVTALFNLNPLLELDGYYILIDWLQIPGLRNRAFRFLTGKFWGQLAQRQMPKREEIILLLYGFAALAYFGFMILCTIWTLQTQIIGWISRTLVENDVLSKFAFGFYSLILGLPLALTLLIVGVNLGSNLLKFGWHLIKQLSSTKQWWLSHIILLACALWVVPLITWFLALVGSLLLSTSWKKFWLLPWLSAALVIGLLYQILQITEFFPARQLLWFGGAALFLIWVTSYHRLRRPANQKIESWLQFALVLLAIGLAQFPFWLGLESAALHGLTLALIGLACAEFLPGLIQQSRSIFWRGNFCLMAALVLWSLTPINGFWANLAGGELILSAFFYYLSFRQSGQRIAPPPIVAVNNDADRLQQATFHVIEGLVTAVAQNLGQSSAIQIRERLNALSLLAGWGLQIGVDNKLVELAEAAKANESLKQLGYRLSRVLDQTLQLIKELDNAYSARLALERSYDTLDWESRELIQDHVLVVSAYQNWLVHENVTGYSRRIELLQTIPLFYGCSLTEFRQLALAFRLHRYRSGQIIVRQAEKGDSFFVIQHGSVGVWQKDREGHPVQVNRHERAEWFGEISLLHHAPRNATCKAITDCELLVLSRTDFERWAIRGFANLAHLQELYRRMQLLQCNAFFAELELEQLRELAAQLEIIEAASGEIIIEQNTIGQELYLIEQGWLEIRLENQQIIGRRGPGEIVGEIALWLDSPRTASAYAIEPVRLLVLKYNVLRDLLQTSEHTRQMVERTASRRWYTLKTT